MAVTAKDQLAAYLKGGDEEAKAEFALAAMEFVTPKQEVNELLALTVLASLRPKTYQDIQELRMKAEE